MQFTGRNITYAIIITVIIGLIIIIAIPSFDDVQKLIKHTVYVSPLLLPFDAKDKIADGVINIAKIVRYHTYEIPKYMTRVIVKLTPTNIMKKASEGLPFGIIEDTQCHRIKINNKKLGTEKAKGSEDLPWDNCAPDYKKLEDVDLDQKLFSNNPPIILY